MRYPDRVRVTFTTHSAGGLTDLDVTLAHRVSALAAQAGARAEPQAVQALEIAIDTMDADRIRPFWAAVLGYREVDGALVDPLRLGPSVWFQQMDEPRTDRDRFHLDVTVPHDVAEDRVEAAARRRRHAGRGPLRPLVVDPRRRRRQRGVRVHLAGPHR